MALRRTGLWAAVWAVGILVLTLMPASDVPDLGWAARLHADKLVHAFLFGVQGVLLGITLAGRRRWRSYYHPWIIAVLVAVLFGAAVEGLQEWMGLGRHAEFADLLADAAGAVVGFFAYHVWRSRR